MTLRARLQGPLLWTVSVVTLLALMFGVARLVPEQPYLALLVAVVVLMLGLTLADPTVIPLLSMPVLLVVVRVSAGGIALSVSDVVLFVAFWPAVVLGGRPYSPPMRSLLWLTAVYQACTLFTVVANPTHGSLTGQALRIFPVNLAGSVFRDGVGMSRSS